MVIMRKMKEKCKDAARMRREKERVEFVELSKLLPLPSSTTSQLDKASIIRLTSSYLRMRSAFPQGLGENWGNKQSSLPFRDSFKFKEPVWPELLPAKTPTSAGNVANSSQFSTQIKELGSLLLQTLDGFVFALHRDGKIMYISETASVHLGLPQIDLTGSSVFDYIHPADHNDIMDILDLSESERTKLAERDQDQLGRSDETIELGRSFCMRMKCVLPKRNAGLVSNGYKAIHCSGYLKASRRRPSTSYQNNSKISESQLTNQKVWDSYALVAVGHSLLSTASTEIKLDAKTFMFRANLDLKFHFIETLATSILGYQQSDLICQSLYQFVHVADLHHLELAHKQVLDKGQVVSKYYRLMRRAGGYVWVQTYATIINNPRSIPKPQHIVGICRVIGEGQCDDSHLLLARDPPRETEFTSSTTKKASEQPLVLINSDSWIAQTTGGSKSSSRFMNRCNRGQKRAAARQQQQQSSRTSRSYDFKHRTSLDICNAKFAASALRTIGSMRRASDDSCSIVSSVASSTGSQSTSGQCSGSNQTTCAPPYNATNLEPTYPHKIAVMRLQDYDNGAPFQSASVSQHTNQYSTGTIMGSHTENCELQDYWPRCGRQSDGTTYPMNMNTSIDRSQPSWPTTMATTISPTPTSSTAAASRASGDGSPAGVRTLSPERVYPSEQYYYRVYGPEVPCDSYHNDDCNASHVNGSQVYMDYSVGHGNLVPMPHDDQFTQAFYHTSHQEASYLTGNSPA